MAGRPAGSTGTGGGVGGAEAKQLVQLLRSDLNSLSNEAKKKYPAVREVCMLEERRRGCVNCILHAFSEAHEACCPLFI